MSSLDKKNNKKLKSIFNTIMDRYAIFLIVVFMVFVFILAYKLIISPVSASINGEIKAINENREIQKQYFLKTLENIKKYKEDYENININDRKRIDLMIPDKSDVDQLFSDIELLVLKNGFILNSLEIDKFDKKIKKAKKVKSSDDSLKTENNNLGIINLKLDVSNSGYEKFKKLLNAFENNLRILDVYNINFSPDGASINFDIRTYYFKQNAQPKNK